MGNRKWHTAGVRVPCGGLIFNIVFMSDFELQVREILGIESYVSQEDLLAMIDERQRVYQIMKSALDIKVQTKLQVYLDDAGDINVKYQ